MTKMEEKQQVHSDPFSKFMFGEQRNLEKGQDVTSKNESSEQKEWDWLLGGRVPAHAPKKQAQSLPKNFSLDRVLQNVDYDEVMQHVDTILTSANELKPLLKMAKPFIGAFFTKK